MAVVNRGGEVCIVELIPFVDQNIERPSGFCSGRVEVPALPVEFILKHGERLRDEVVCGDRGLVFEDVRDPQYLVDDAL